MIGFSTPVLLLERLQGGPFGGGPQQTPRSFSPSPCVPKPQVPSKSERPPRRDLEFLPAALEIVETPLSPMRVGILLAICALVFATIAWLCLATFDIHAVAVGKIQPNGRTKFVQPSEPGRVSALRVENGSNVKAGDVLIELDPTVAAADRAALERSLASVSAEVTARRAVLAWATDSAGAPFADVNPIAASKEAALVIAEAARLGSTLDSLSAQRLEAEARRARLAAAIEVRAKLLVLLKERVDTRQALDQSGQGYRGKVIDALESHQRETAVLIGDQGQLAETEAQIASLASKRREAVTQFVAEQRRALLDAERKRDQTAQDLVKAVSRDERMELRAPVDGIVQQLGVTTVGQFVQSGEPLLSIVPLDARIEVEALVANKDIGFVEVGQNAVVKVDAFPFTRYGTIGGRLVKVSRDAVDQRATGVTTDALSAPRGAAPASAAGAPQSLVFPVTVTLDQTSIAVGASKVTLTPGMSVTVEIKTGERRAIDFLLSPVSEIVSSSGKER